MRSDNATDLVSRAIHYFREKSAPKNAQQTSMLFPSRPTTQIAWGIPTFDKFSGLTNHAANILKTTDHRAGLVALLHFLAEGLATGGRVAVVTFERAEILLAVAQEYGFRFERALETEQLQCLVFRPQASQTLPFLVDYDAVLEEIVLLTHGPVYRLALASIDVFLNGQTACLARESAQKLASAAEQLRTTILGYYIETSSSYSSNIDAGIRAFISSYLSLTACDGPDIYTLRWQSCPFSASDFSPTLKLKKGCGFCESDEYLDARRA
jgi:hypothetical protein